MPSIVLDGHREASPSPARRRLSGGGACRSHRPSRSKLPQRRPSPRVSWARPWAPAASRSNSFYRPRRCRSVAARPNRPAGAIKPIGPPGAARLNGTSKERSARAAHLQVGVAGEGAAEGRFRRPRPAYQAPPTRRRARRSAPRSGPARCCATTFASGRSIAFTFAAMTRTALSPARTSGGLGAEGGRRLAGEGVGEFAQVFLFHGAAGARSARSST